MANRTTPAVFNTKDAYSTSSPVLIGSGKYVKTSIGVSHAAALDSNGTLTVWGDNTLGQLGDNKASENIKVYDLITDGYKINDVIDFAISNSTMFIVDSSNNLYAWGDANSQLIGTNLSDDQSWTVLSTGQSHAAGIKADGTLWTWGDNLYGQLGDNALSGTRTYRPVQIPGSWLAVSAGNRFTLGINSIGELYAWGINSYGELGLGDRIYRSSPTQIGSSNTWLKVAAGNNFSFGLNSLNQLYAWGQNDSYVFFTTGVGLNLSRSSPVFVASSARDIVAGRRHAHYIRSTDNTIRSAGDNTYGQLGNGVRVPTANSGANTDPAIPVASVFTSSSSDSSFAIQSNGNLYVWGRNLNGALGLPFNVEDTAKRYTNVLINRNSIIATDNVGRLYAIGDGTGANSGIRPQISSQSTSPVLVNSSFNVATIVVSSASDASVYSNNATAAFITDTNKTYMWGSNDTGQLGITSLTSRSFPTLVNTTASFTTVAAGTRASAGIDTNGVLYTWGDNQRGTLGTGSETIVDYDATTYNTYAVRTDGKLFAWGNNASGQLGINNTLNRSSPVLVSSTSSFTKVAASGSTAFAITVDDRLFAWGAGTTGQLGNNSALNRSSPVQVAGSWTKVSGSVFHTLMIASNGNLFSTGTNFDGQLGLDATLPPRRSSPVLVSSDAFTDISTGTYQSAAIRDDGALFVWGRDYPQLGLSKPSFSKVESAGDARFAIDDVGQLWAWGRAQYSLLGINSLQSRSTPVLVSGLNSVNVTSISVTAHDATAIAVSNTGDMYMWGNGTGIGFGTSSIANAVVVNSPIQVFSGTSWSYATGDGYYNNYAIRSDGRLYGWGINTDYKQLDSLGSEINFTSIKGKFDSTAGLSNTNLLYAWGLNTSGQLGDISIINKSSPVQVSADTVLDFDFGFAHLAFIKQDGTLWSVGQAGAGRLGDGQTAFNRSDPVQIGSNTDWVKVSLGIDCSAAINSSNELYVWGGNSLGQLGLGDTINRSNPTQVTGSWSDIKVGISHMLGLAANGDYYTWGHNSSGQLGDNSTINKSNPTFLTTNTNIEYISVEGNYGFILTGNNNLFAWGNNFYGQLGINNRLNRSSPVLVAANVSTIRTHTYHALANIDGSIYAWGINSNGQLGLNMTFGRSSPTLVSYSLDVFKYDGTGGITVAVDSANSYYAWGMGASGQLGHFAATSRSSPVTALSSAYNRYSAPVAIDTVKSFTQVSTSGLHNHAFAIDSDSRLYAWGNNTNGQLGLGDTLSRSSPTQVAGSWSKINAKGSTIYGIKVDGTLWAWGNNQTGGLGLNTAASDRRSEPTQIGSETYWVDVQASREIVVSDLVGVTALANTGEVYGWGANNLGQPTGLNRSSPVLVSTVANASQVAVNLVVTDEGRLKAFGDNVYGQLGALSTSNAFAQGHFISPIISRSSPTQIGTDSWIKVSTSTDVKMAIKADGTLWGWGNNLYGAVGTGIASFDYNSVDEPTQIGSSNTWVDVHVLNIDGAHVTVGLKTEGSNNVLYGWGDNTGKYFGPDNTASYYSSPVAIAYTSTSFPLTDAVKVKAGAISSPTNPYLYTWGFNTTGRLGDLAAALVETSNAELQEITMTKFAQFEPAALLSFGSFTQVTINHESALAIKTDGSLWAWGNNTYGQLGNDSITNIVVPQKIGTSSWTKVFTNGLTTAAIDINGRLFTWGFNFDGRLGLTDTVYRSSPVQVTSDTSFTMVHVGQDSIVAISNTGDLYAWGKNDNNQLGINDQVSRSSPTQIGAGISFVNASTSEFGLVALSNTNEIYGSTDNTVLAGDGFSRIYGIERIWPDHPHRSNPIQVGIGTSWTAAAAGDGLGLFKSNTNNLFFTGSKVKTTGSLNYTLRSSPTLVSAGAGKIAAGGNNVIIYELSNTLYSTGYDSNEMLGTGLDIDLTDSVLQLETNKVLFVDTTSKSSPTLIGAGFSKVYADNTHVGAIASNGMLFTWGDNQDGELGIGNYARAGHPTPVDSNVSFSQLAIGKNFMAGISNTELYTWGSREYGQLGDGIDASDRISPTQVANNKLWTSAAASSRGLYLLDNYKNLHLAGAITANYFKGNGWDQIAVGSKLDRAHNIGIKDGYVFAWGNNFYGQLGQSDTVNRSSPTLVSGLSNVVEVKAGHYVSGALTSDGDLYMWGDNTYGQLGLTSTIRRSEPVLVASNVVYFDTDGYNSAYVHSNNALFVWGYNVVSSLGLNTFARRSSPTFVLSGINKVKTTYWNTYAVASNGIILAAGEGVYGVLGDGSINDNPVFAPIIGLSNNIVDAALTLRNGYILASNGYLLVTGSNTYVGLGAFLTGGTRTSPILLGGNNYTELQGKYESVKAGEFHTAAIVNDEGTKKLYTWGVFLNGNAAPTANSTTFFNPVTAPFPTASLQLTNIVTSSGLGGFGNFYSNTIADYFVGLGTTGIIDTNGYAYAHGIVTDITSNTAVRQFLAGNTVFGNSATEHAYYTSNTEPTKLSNSVWSEINSNEISLTAIKIRR